MLNKFELAFNKRYNCDEDKLDYKIKYIYLSKEMATPIPMRNIIFELLEQTRDNYLTNKLHWLFTLGHAALPHLYLVFSDVNFLDTTYKRNYYIGSSIILFF